MQSGKYANYNRGMFANLDTNNLVNLAENLSAARGLTANTVSLMAANDGKLINRIRQGGGLTIRRYNKILQWFSDHWPVNLEWPDGIPRPAPSVLPQAVKGTADARGKSPLTALSEEGIIANPNAFCRALFTTRDIYDQAVRQYRAGGPRQHCFPRAGSKTHRVVQALVFAGDRRFAHLANRAWGAHVATAKDTATYYSGAENNRGRA